MRRLRRIVIDRCVRPVWRGLVAFGSVYAGTGAPPPEPRDACEPSVPYGPGLAADGDPPPGHPERLRPDLPLTELEHTLLRELWPVRRPPGRGPMPS